MIVCPACGSPAVPQRRPKGKHSRGGPMVRDTRGPGTYVWECAKHGVLVVEKAVAVAGRAAL
jgi:hypothetical protein